MSNLAVSIIYSKPCLIGDTESHQQSFTGFYRVLREMSVMEEKEFD